VTVAVEDEYHFLMDCPKYANERLNLVHDLLTKFNIDIEVLPDKQSKLNLLLSNSETAGLVADVIYSLIVENVNMRKCCVPIPLAGVAVQS
jgi:hypothetical protein